MRPTTASPRVSRHRTKRSNDSAGRADVAAATLITRLVVTRVNTGRAAHRFRRAASHHGTLSRDACRHRLHTDPLRAGAGLVLFAVGLGFAIWARVHIGRNWGTPMTSKDEPELVTTGPYRYVRHPIYSGILVAGARTAVALSWIRLIAVVLAGIYFLYSATVEERFLTEQFPDAYPAYKRATKMLVPFLF